MIPIDLSGETYLVTGAGGSIGAAVAQLLSEAGAGIIAADTDEARVLQLAAGIAESGGTCTPITMDVTSEHSINTGLRLGVERLGSPTGLVNAAGILRAATLDAFTLDEWNTIMSVNSTGTFLATRALLPHFRAQGRGSVVNLSSVAAFSGSPVGSAYHATKGAVLSFTYATAGELAPEGFRVNAVCPGWVDGGFTHQALAESSNPESMRAAARSAHLLGRMATPLDVAGAVLWLMSPLASFVTGTAVFVDGGFMVKH